MLHSHMGQGIYLRMDQVEFVEDRVCSDMVSQSRPNFWSILEYLDPYEPVKGLQTIECLNRK